MVMSDPSEVLRDVNIQGSSCQEDRGSGIPRIHKVASSVLGVLQAGTKSVSLPDARSCDEDRHEMNPSFPSSSC